MNKIVSTAYYHGYILIFCENGDIYKMVVDELDAWKVSYYLIDRFRPQL